MPLKTAKQLWTEFFQMLLAISEWFFWAGCLVGIGLALAIVLDIRREVYEINNSLHHHRENVEWAAHKKGPSEAAPTSD